MRSVKVAIIGAGPRGLTVLERMLEHASALPPEVRLEIELYDRRPFGEGVHDSLQPDHLLINTVSSQVTMFPPTSIAGDGPGFSLVQWARREGYRRLDGVFCKAGAGMGKSITDADYLPRSILGAYLAWFYEQLASRMPDNIHLHARLEGVIDLIPHREGYDVVLENGDVRSVEYAVIATGHGNRQPTHQDLAHSAFASQWQASNPELRYVCTPYPVEPLDDIAPHATVAIQGFGLTAHDVISALTLGRGGRYVQQNGQLKYLPSGEEPKLLLFSRNCLPFAARGINQKGLTGKHTARYFTPAAVLLRREQVLARTGSPQLDFRDDVLPLIIKEMAYAYRVAATCKAVEEEGFQPEHAELDAINRILWPLQGHVFTDQQRFEAFFEELVHDDLAHALLGNVGSPVKAATDVLRDTRDALRIAVEHSGLTPESHRYFIEHFNAITNRVSFGPPPQRLFEYQALRAAGLIQLAGGPGARLIMDSERYQYGVETVYAACTERQYADVLVVARLDTYSPLSDGSVLTRNLLGRGLVRPYRNGAYHPGGIDIDANLQPINQQGVTEQRLWALGYPVEGQHFYTHALPRPGIDSRQTQDAQRCVLGIWQALTRFANDAAERPTRCLPRSEP